MFTYTPDLKLRGPLQLDGEEVTCRRCDSGASLTLDKRGPRETWPAWLGCEACGHGSDHPTITNGLLAAALTACPGRTRAEDRDLFTAEWRGHTLTGERWPEVIPADIIAVTKVWADTGRKELRKHRRRWWRTTKSSAKKQARQAIGGAKAAALRTAWDAQTGGAGPVKPPVRRCRVKGCRAGWLTITSRMHGSSGRAEKVKVPCSTCHRAG